LTSDDVEFKTGLSNSLETEEEKRIEELYTGMRKTLAAEPSLIFAFLPGMPHSFTGDKILEILDRLSGGIPFFGSNAVDIDHAVQRPMTIHNGTAHSDRFCLMMLVGNIKPRFFINTIINHDIFYHKARITAAEENRLISIDDMPAVKYMEKIGILENGALETISAFPMLADPQDGGEPKLLIFTSIDSEGAMICISKVSKGSVLSIGTPTTALVLDDAMDLINKIKQEQGQNGLLIFSCVSRDMALADPLSEMETVREQFRDSSTPFLFMYSGGEICPRHETNNKTTNMFHAYAIIACIF
jgi:hypothetical protein